MAPPGAPYFHLIGLLINMMVHVHRMEFGTIQKQSEETG